VITRFGVIILELSLVAGLIVMSGCPSWGYTQSRDWIDAQQQPNDCASTSTLPKDKYVAIEERLVTSSKLIGGEDPFPSHIMPPAVFNYDSSVKGSNRAEGSNWENARRPGNYPEINASLMALLGTSYYKDIAPKDTRTGLSVKGVYSFPYAGESGFIIESVDSDGTIYGRYNNTSIALKHGERWVSPVVSDIKSANGTAADDKPYSYMAQYDTTWTVFNLGAFDKASLAQHNNVKV